jgi:hypothetical protein
MKKKTEIEVKQTSFRTPIFNSNFFLTQRQIYSSKGRFLKPVVKAAEWAEIVASAKV